MPRYDAHEVADAIRRLARRAELEKTVAVGQLIMEQLFDGSIEAWLQRRNHKNNPVERLESCASCPLSRAALNHAVGIYVLTLAWPSVLELPHLEASHIIAVLRLSSSEQVRWLQRANAERWSAARLKEAIRDERRSKRVLLTGRGLDSISYPATLRDAGSAPEQGRRR